MLKASKASLGAIALAGLALTCAADGPDKAQRVGAKAAARATKELAAHAAPAAVADAERAVELAPRDGAFRLLLGQSYLQAGRFASARAAFADTLLLDPANGRAALNLALAETALGDWQAARGTLAAHTAEIGGSDLGLALALAGDTNGAIAALTAAARAPGAGPKVRQNLALAYALGGQWQLARVIAAADMSPAEVDARLEQWAGFAQPHGAADQVASLMGVKPAATDVGQPAALALAPAAPTVAAAPVAVAATSAVQQPATTIEQPAPVAVAATPAVTFAARHEVVQPLAVALIPDRATPFKTPLAPVAAARPVRAHVDAPVKARGSFVVQLGAYKDMAVAQHAWGKATRRVAAFAGHQAQGVSIKTASATLFRLSVGGFSRAGADQLCRQYRAHGGDCFVRAAAGDQLAHWATPPVKVAARARPKSVQVAAR